MAAVANPVIHLRVMHTDDLVSVSEMENASYEFPWSQGVFADCLRVGHSCWVLCVDARIAGYGILSIGAGESHLLNLCIAAGYRGKGFGRHLLRQLIDIARWYGAERIFLEVRPSNPLAKALYDSLDFKEIGRRPRYYPAKDGREDAIVMVRELRATPD